MRMLVAKFISEQSAEIALRALVAAGVDDSRIIRAPAANAEHAPPAHTGVEVEVSPDAAVSAGAEHSAAFTFAGAALGSVIGAAAGIVTAPVLGPIGIAAGVGVGAYAGSLVGALAGLDPAEVDPPLRSHSAPEDSLTTLTIAPANETDSRRAQEIIRSFGVAVMEHDQPTERP